MKTIGFDNTNIATVEDANIAIAEANETSQAKFLATLGTKSSGLGPTKLQGSTVNLHNPTSPKNAM